jgi:hypothetical protein
MFRVVQRAVIVLAVAETLLQLLGGGSVIGVDVVALFGINRSAFQKLAGVALFMASGFMFMLQSRSWCLLLFVLGVTFSALSGIAGS